MSRIFSTFQFSYKQLPNISKSGTNISSTTVLHSFSAQVVNKGFSPTHNMDVKLSAKYIYKKGERM